MRHTRCMGHRVFLRPILLQQLKMMKRMMAYLAVRNIPRIIDFTFARRRRRITQTLTPLLAAPLSGLVFAEIKVQ